MRAKLHLMEFFPASRERSARRASEGHQQTFGEGLGLIKEKGHCMQKSKVTGWLYVVLWISFFVAEISTQEHGSILWRLSDESKPKPARASPRCCHLPEDSLLTSCPAVGGHRVIPRGRCMAGSSPSTFVSTVGGVVIFEIWPPING